MDHLCKFNFDFKYIEGKENVIADALSQYHEYDQENETWDYHHYVNADKRLELEDEKDTSELISAAINAARPKREIKKTYKVREATEPKTPKLQEGQKARKAQPKLLKEAVEP
jgi:hypothetical protein